MLSSERVVVVVVVLAPALPSSPMGFAGPPKWLKSGTGSVRGRFLTCLITVFPIRTLHTLKAAGGLPLNDPLPGPCQAVPAAVGEGHLRVENTQERGLHPGVKGQSYNSFDMGQVRNLGVRISVANSGPF